MPRSFHLILVLSALMSGTGIANGPQPTLRVLCYNIHHGRGMDDEVDLKRIAAVIRAAKPDLVALQEVDHKTRRTGGIDQTAELARLTGMHGRFARQIDFEGGQYGQAILSRVPIAEVEVLWLPGQPDRERRIIGRVKVVIDGRELWFATTHLHHMSEEFRVAQVEEIGNLFAQESIPAIVAGDFNATPESRPIELAKQQWSLALADQPLWTFPADKPIKQIDYIAHRPKSALRLIEVQVIDERMSSDHAPLLAVYQWGEAGNE